VDLATYLEKTSTAEGVDPSAISRIELWLEGGKTFGDLALRKDLGIPAQTLLDIAGAYLELQEWRERTAPLREQVSAALLAQAVLPHQVHALERVGRLVSRSRQEVAYELWQRCFSVALKDGEVRIDGAPGKGFDEYLRKRELLSDMAPHRWLRIRRGERARALFLDLSYPVSELRAQAELLGAEEELPRIVLKALPSDLRRYMDWQAERQAIRAARTSYESLLSARPVDAFPVLAVAVGRQLGVVILDEDGTPVHHESARHEDRVVRLAREHQVRTVVLPTRSPTQARLARLKQALGGAYAITQVLPAGLAPAASGLPFPRPVASAVVLGRRAISPMKEWSRMDPVRLGIVEYQADLDETRLRDALVLTRDIVKARGETRISTAAATPRLGLTSRRLEDLRPGQMVEGVVTNITPFGAFVNLGLAQEGLIHVSEIADRFVSDPAEVVRIGQTVLAKVLHVDPERRRISLSLRRKERPSGRAAQASRRSRALSALDDLFKS